MHQYIMEMNFHFYKMGRYDNEVLELLYSEYIMNIGLSLEYQQSYEFKMKILYIV